MRGKSVNNVEELSNTEMLSKGKNLNFFNLSASENLYSQSCRRIFSYSIIKLSFILPVCLVHALTF